MHTPKERNEGCSHVTLSLSDFLMLDGASTPLLIQFLCIKCLSFRWKYFLNRQKWVAASAVYFFWLIETGDIDIRL